MKKYAKPIMLSNEISEINESIYLYASGWVNSNCYFPSWERKQEMENGRNNWVYQVTANHDATKSPEWLGHSNENQYLIVVFEQPLPAEVTSITINNNTCEISPDRMRIRGLTDYHQNSWDMIGTGAFTITFGFSDESAEARLFSLIQFDEFEISDIDFRHS